MNLTAREFSEIIKSCKDSGVTELILEEKFWRSTTRIVFGPKPNVTEKPTLNQPSESENKEINQLNEVKFTDRPVNPERDDEQRTLDDLMISDPARYEQMIARGEIIDDGSTKENNRGPE